MKASSKREKWAAAVLGMVAVALLANLAVRSNMPYPVKAGVTRPAEPRAVSTSAPRKAASSSVDDLARYDPEVRVALLTKLDSRALPEIERNPFDFGLTPEEQRAKQNPPPVTAPTPPPPPPPPPVTVTALGYAEAAGGRKAFLADDQDNYEVKEGESFANKYKVLRITPAAVTIEVEDETPHRSVELPYPEEKP
jgi:hypothetical protein